MPCRVHAIPQTSILVAVLSLASCTEAQALVFTWSGGEYGAQGLPNPLDGDSVVNVVAGAPKSIAGGIVNDGRFNWLSTNPLSFGDGALFQNRGVFDQRADGRMLVPSGAATFENSGTLVKSGGPGDLLLDVTLVNHAGAVLDAASGRIVYRGNDRFEDGSVFRGTGVHQFNAGAATFSFLGSLVAENGLLFTAGTFSAVAPTRAQGNISFVSGTFAGQWTIVGGHTLTGSVGLGKSISGSLVNEGTIAWNTSDGLNLSGTALLRNEGTFDQQTDGRILAPGGTALFDNRGIVKKSGGTGDLLLDAPLHNRSGAVLDASSGRIVYRGNDQFDAGSVFAGAGAHVFNAGAATFTFHGDFVGENNVFFAAGTYHAALPTRPQTDVMFTNGGFTGQWIIDSGRTLAATGSFGKGISGSFVNDGKVIWNTGTPLSLNLAGGTTTLVNNGLFEQQTDGRIVAAFDLPTMANIGTLRKSGGSGNFVIGVAIVNTGAIESLSGNIVLPTDWRNDGTLRGTAAFQTNRLTNAGDIAPGMPGPAQAIAALALTGALDETAGGTLSFDVDAGGVSDVFNVSGAVVFDGTVHVSRHGSYLPQLGDSFRVMNFASFSGQLLDVLEFGFGSDVQFVAVYGPTYLELRVAAVPEPGTWGTMLCGLGMLLTALRKTRRHAQSSSPSS